VQANCETNLNDEVVKTIKSFGNTIWQTSVAQLFDRMTCALSPARMWRPNV